jgi:hypothetical protein
MITDEAAKSLIEMVNELKWTYAKTMPWCPHFYIVRNPAIEERYVKLWNAINEFGDVGYFGETRRLYLHLGDGYKYWHMSDDLSMSKIINRAKDE